MFTFKEKFLSRSQGIRGFFSGTLGQVIASILLIVIIFASGYYFGNDGREGFRININGSEESTGADLAPFWKAWEILDDKFVGSASTTNITSEDKVWASIEGLASAYGDPYTVFFPPVESQMFAEEIRGSFNGVGMEIASQEGLLTVVSPLKGSPAERAGVKPGDKIIQINDTPAARLPVDEAVSLIRGEGGTTVKITFQREGTTEPIVRNITREAISIPTLDTELLPSGVFLISLYSFSENSPNLFRQALREFVESGSNKLILDLRNNPGGYLEAAVSMASWFLPRSDIVVSEDFGGKRENVEHRSQGYNIFNDNLRFAILINGGSASASEILAGALREHNKATLIGENTFGKGSVQELVPITDDTSLKVTIAHWLTPLGNSISEGGVVPDIEVKITAEDATSGRDPQLERAVEFLTTGK